MEKHKISNSEIEITPFLMGTWQAGKRMWVGIEDDESIKAIRAAFDAGITTIDTAEIYGEGHSEAQGLLTGKFPSNHQFAEGDRRSKNQRFTGDNFVRAQKSLGQLRPIAEHYGCTLAQLAWFVVNCPNPCDRRREMPIKRLITRKQLLFIFLLKI